MYEAVFYCNGDALIMMICTETNVLEVRQFTV